jgi:hypothetical protein
MTVGQNEIDNINQMITITGHFYKIVYYNLVKWTHEVWSVKVADNINRDHIKKLPLYKLISDAALKCCEKDGANSAETKKQCLSFEYCRSTTYLKMGKFG